MTSSPMLRSTAVFLVLLLVVATTACTGRRGNRGGRDGVDLGRGGDAGSDDAGSFDAGGFDLGGFDLGGFDAGRRDLGGDPGGEGELRLGASGLLEVYYMGQWGTVCDDSFDDVDAQVACRQLGYADGTWSPATVPGTGEIFMDDIACTGTEARLADCIFSGWAVHNCSHSEDVALECVGGAP